MKMTRKDKRNRGIYVARTKERKDATPATPPTRRCEVCRGIEELAAPHQHAA